MITEHLKPKLFMLMLGCTPPGRHTEQHDIFFGIAHQLKDLIPEIKQFWPEAQDKIHIDAWREVNYIDGYTIEVSTEKCAAENDLNLFVINLGGYKKNEFDELHYKMLIAATSVKDAIKTAKASAFFKHNTFNEAHAHIDDKYGVDIDELHQVLEILPNHHKDLYHLQVTKTNSTLVDEIHLGYLPLKNLK